MTSNNTNSTKSLDELRKALKQTSARQGQGFSPFKMPQDSTAVVRFINDPDADNFLYWKSIERYMIPFTTMINHPEGLDFSEPVKITLPAMGTWGEKCPASEVSRDFYSQGNKKDGSTYYRKKAMLLQGFVQSDPGDKDNDSSLLRNFLFTAQILKTVEVGLADPEIENIPTDIKVGLDFNIKKSLKAGFNDYSTSSYARKESALTPEQIKSMEDAMPLSSLVFDRPDADQQQIILEMLQDSSLGLPYDYSKFGHHYTPYGVTKGLTKTVSLDDVAERLAENKALTDNPRSADLRKIKGVS